MTYVGRGVDAISNVDKLDNITFNGGTTYNLTKSSVAFTPSGANNILISIDGVVQSGNFSIANNTIVFDWSPTSNNTCNWIQHYGTGVLNVPADGTITASKMGANSVDSDSYVDGSIDAVHMSANSIDSDSYVDLSIDTAHIGATQITGAKLNNDVISAQTALASEPADTDEFMVSDGGVLKRIDYSLIKGGGSWNLLQTQNASTDSSITFSSTYITSTYDVYKIIINHLISSSDGDAVRVAAATDNSTFNKQGYCALSYFATDGSSFTTATGQPNAAGYIAIGYYISNTSTSGAWNSELTIYNPSPNRDTIMTIASGQQSSAGKFVNESGVLKWNQGALNAFRFGCNAGTMTGTFSLYGLTK